MKKLIVILAVLAIGLSAQDKKAKAPKVQHTDATPVVKPLSDADTKDLQIIGLQLQIATRTVQDLQVQQNMAVEKICNAAGIALTDCAIDMQKKLISKVERPNATAPPAPMSTPVVDPPTPPATAPDPKKQ